jgi:hypothetical protein
MARKTATSNKVGIEIRDEHELLQQEDFGWLAEMRDVLSPYWSSRVEYHADKRGPVLVLEESRSPNR